MCGLPEKDLNNINIWVGMGNLASSGFRTSIIIHFILICKRLIFFVSLHSRSNFHIKTFNIFYFLAKSLRECYVYSCIIGVKITFCFKYIICTLKIQIMFQTFYGISLSLGIFDNH